MLDPDCAKVHALFALAARPPIETLTAPQARDAMRRSRAVLQPEPPEVSVVRSQVAAGATGPIPLRLYRPLGAPVEAKLPALVYYHGGGWVIGDLDTHDTLCRELCNGSGVCVISVDYRLAPEHRFPAAVDDAFAALKWIAVNAASLHIDATRLAVGGDSAGGNLAAVVALMARDAKAPPIKLQVLIYPVADFTLATESYRTRGDVLPLTRAAMMWFRDQYFGDAATDPAVIRDWRASPSRARDHAGLPPAFVITAGYDVLCDEGRAYAEQLRAAGNAVEAVHYDGMIHGFIGMGKIVRIANEAVAATAAAVRRTLA